MVVAAELLDHMSEESMFLLGIPKFLDKTLSF